MSEIEKALEATDKYRERKIEWKGKNLKRNEQTEKLYALKYKRYESDLILARKLCSKRSWTQYVLGSP